MMKIMEMKHWKYNYHQNSTKTVEARSSILEYVKKLETFI